ncbi:MAG: bifunctional adenosylcobinamide kinase/adenosylcobinamide-phosphate guanylyltransferase [Bacteroidales bacterium]
MRKIILITGGQRSGKSSYAEKLALEMTHGANGPVYLATAHIWDDEFAKRVERHKASRGDMWTNIEEEKELSRHNITGRVVVIDCITLWATNFFFDEHNVQLALLQLKTEFDKFTLQEATFIFVTNEIGLGGVSDNKLQRQFTDLQGWINQYIASKADQVILMVSGIIVKIK